MSDKNAWKLHNTYDPGVSFNRIVTRSQTAFVRLNNTDSDLELFCDPLRHQPPGMPHLMETLKGKYGALPNTIITMSTGEHLTKSKDLIKAVDEYKKYKPEEETKKEEVKPVDNRAKG